MIQTTLSVPLEVRPESVARLSALIDRFKQDEDRPKEGGKNFERLHKGLPTGPQVDRPDRTRHACS